MILISVSLILQHFYGIQDLEAHKKRITTALQWFFYLRLFNRNCWIPVKVTVQNLFVTVFRI
jgi:hypothetical protein